MYEEAIGPGRTGHRRKPMIAHRKFSCQGRNYRKLIWRVTFHDLTWMGWIDSSIIGHKASVINVRIIALDSAELYFNIGKFMAWIVRHCPVGRGGNKYFTSIRREIPISGKVQTLDGGRLPGDGVGTL